MMVETIPANGEKACACCGRFHRKLVLSVTGHWCGQTCSENVKHYVGNPNSVYFVGRDSLKARIKAMIG